MIWLKRSALVLLALIAAISLIAWLTHLQGVFG